MIIYRDCNRIDLEWLQQINFRQPYTLCRSLAVFLSSADPVKLAFTGHRLQCDYDSDIAYEDKIQQLSAVSRYVFSIESELHYYHWDIWKRSHRDNVYYVLPGTVNDSPIRFNIVFWGDWYKTTSWVYKELPNKLAKITPYTVKPKSFDALLGKSKPHRDFVYQLVVENHLQDQFIIPYGDRWQGNEFNVGNYYIWETGVTVLDHPATTVSRARYHHIETSLSRIIPIQVYNDTAYSIVAETGDDNSISFYTEKTAKPMIARRLFVAFTGYRFLENLRAQGFQTFNGIIDESYDLIKDNHKRFAAAFEQVKYLCSQPQLEIFEKIQPIVEHNYQHIMNTVWTTQAAKQIESML